MNWQNLEMNMMARKPDFTPDNTTIPSTPSTHHDNLSYAASPTDHDSISQSSNKFAASEEAQFKIAVRNSLKDSFPKSSFSPEGIHISELRTKRRLFNEADKKMLSSQKRPTGYHDLSQTSGFSNVASKAMNRMANNSLDPAYFQLTQLETEDDFIESPPRKVTRSSPTKKDTKLWDAIRGECIRLMNPDVDPIKKDKAIALYKVITIPSQNSDINVVIQTMAVDCERRGMTTNATVECMLHLV